MEFILGQFLDGYRKPDGFINDLLDRDDLEKLPDCSGAYILTSKRVNFLYPNGKSQVLYIGKADNLYSRLKRHHGALQKLSTLKRQELNGEWHYKRYQYMRKFGCRLFWYSIRGTQDAKNLESELMEWFYDRYLAIPIGNGAFSFGNNS